MSKHPWGRQTFSNAGVSNSTLPTGGRHLGQEALSSGWSSEELSCPLLSRKIFTFFLFCFWLAVSAVPDAGEVYDRYRPGNGIPQQQELHPQRPCCSQLHVSLTSATFQDHAAVLQLADDHFTETKSLWRFSLLQAEWEHECVCGWLWPLQEDLQWRLLQTGEDLQDACEVDRYWKLGWSCLHHQKWCGEFSNPVLLLYRDFFYCIVYWLGLRIMFKVKFCFQLRYPTVLISVTADTIIKTLV